MKEAYWDKVTIHKVTYEMIIAVKSFVRLKKMKCSLEGSTLLVIDMQKYFTSRESHAWVPSVEPVIDNINFLINKFSLLGLPVIYTRHVNTESNAGMMKIWWKDLILPDTPLSALDSRILIKGHIIEKGQYDAFWGTSLDKLLKERSVRRIVICGVLTHLCCETTARSAFVRGYEVIFPVDATATYSLAFHKSSLLNLAHGFAYITTTKDITGE